MARETKELDEDLRDMLITISVIAKRLARKLEANQLPTTEKTEEGGNENEQD